MSPVEQIPDLNFAFSGVPNLIDCFPSCIRAAKKIQVYCMSSAHVSDLSCWQRKALQTKTEDHQMKQTKIRKLSLLSVIKMHRISGQESSLGLNQISDHFPCLERRSPLIGRLLPADSGFGLLRCERRFRFRIFSFRFRVVGRDKLLSFTETEQRFNCY